MWAAGQGHASAVRRLLQRGARADLRDNRGLTAADMARQAGHMEVAALLGS
jgi:ankyrin repeat protein